jgi:hypothetical protein
MHFDSSIFVILFLVALLSTICIGGGVYINRRKRATLKNRLGDRQCLSSEAICEQFFRELPKKDVEAVLGELALALEVPLGLLRPNDRFDTDLAYPRGFGYDGRMESLAATFRMHLARQGMAEVENYPETVGDFVRAIIPTGQ